ncbi:Radical SAM domain protein [Alkaliphilus metalliredigens QYMF]|uniref:Radical SAM domain protein n=1 Tax=Alkaliphilus metalliredigens (strain QYMF) TaxID=293826 RepID=A6TKW0_ALKMQ|nr:B12-binding domain-containing radical SAM protein [Alkaliphilus metalliredigens]ABR46828.1 Radical SAM domain protein [Alkaliphilus metalliredigens QYMF]
MKVLLVRPARIKQAVTLGEFMYSEPIGLEMVYAMLENQHHVEIVDMMSEKITLEDKLKAFQPEVVGITSLCIDVFAVRALAEAVKKYDPSIITMVGGTQSFLNPEAFFTETIDHVMKYTNTENMTTLFGYLQRGEQPPIIHGICSGVNDFKTTDKCGMNQYVHPNRKATAKYRRQYSYFGYRPCAIMGTSQGCSKTCSFCLRWRIEGATERYLPMDFVKEEIRSIEEDNIMVFDNDFLHNGDRIEELCNFLQEEGIHKNFICYASVNSILSNKEVIKRFTKLGLSTVLVGYETFKEEELKKYQKKSSTDDNLNASQFLKEIGLDVWASFMIHPDWSVADFKEFRRYLKKLNPEISTFSPLTPFPNLPLYNEYKDRLLIQKEEYEKWSFGQVTINPSKMSLRKYYYEILKTILYVNLVRNNILYMISRFGITSILRLFKGSIKAFIKYIQLMMQ